MLAEPQNTQVNCHGVLSSRGKSMYHQKRGSSKERAHAMQSFKEHYFQLEYVKRKIS
jgi:hypothetical protein